MSYFKYVNLDGWQELSTAINSHIAKLQNFDRSIPTAEWFDSTIFNDIPLIQKIFSTINLTVERAGFFYLPPLSASSIHRDDCPRGFCRINIPVLNCENSITRFYKSRTNKMTLMKQDNGREYYAMDESDCRVVSLVEIIKPTVLDVSEIHQVENYNSVPRIAATFAFKEDIRYLLD